VLSDAATLASLIQQAPALLVAVLSLLFSGWIYRQSRRSAAASEARQAVSAVRQGKRIGAVEKAVGMLDMRRRITEFELEDVGIRLSMWPPDGRPAPARDERAEEGYPDEQAEDGGPSTAARPAMPPLPEMSRHRR
jgi:cbb3-type cytochrome oxidase subunit 3